MSVKTKSSALSALVGRREKKVSVTSPKVDRRHVEFTPEEMAMDCPVDVSDPKTYPTITRGDKDWKKFVNFRNGFARIAPDLRKAFPNDRAVNDALREFLGSKDNGSRSSRKK
jgi:hypothetical protein